MLINCISSITLVLQADDTTSHLSAAYIRAQTWLGFAVEQVVQKFPLQIQPSTIQLVQADLFLLCRLAVNDTAVREHICKLTSLKHLSLLGCHHITDHGLRKLAQTATELQLLDISSCRSA